MSTSSHSILLAALDLDGTLLNSNGEVSPYTQKVLSEASDRGVVVIPATGRPLALCSHLQRCGGLGSRRRPAGLCLQPVCQRRRA